MNNQYAQMPKAFTYVMAAFYLLSALLAPCVLGHSSSLVSSFLAGHFCSLLLGLSSTIGILLYRYHSRVFPDLIIDKFFFAIPCILCLVAAALIAIGRHEHLFNEVALRGLAIGHIAYMLSLHPVLIHEESRRIRLSQLAFL